MVSGHDLESSRKLQMLQVLDESLDLHFALLLRTGHANVVAEVLLAFGPELGPEELNKGIDEERKARFLRIFIEDFEKVRAYVSQVVTHRCLD